MQMTTIIRASNEQAQIQIKIFINHKNQQQINKKTTQINSLSTSNFKIRNTLILLSNLTREATREIIDKIALEEWLIISEEEEIHYMTKNKGLETPQVITAMDTPETIQIDGIQTQIHLNKSGLVFQIGKLAKVIFKINLKNLEKQTKFRCEITMHL